MSAKHVGDVFQLGDPVSIYSLTLVCLDLLSPCFLVGEVLVLIKIISGNLHELSVDFFVCSFFPGHKAVLHADVVPMCQLHLKAVHGVSVMHTVLFPDLQGAVGQVAVA